MTATLKSVLRNATGDRAEVLVTFDVDGTLRNVLLRDATEFTVPLAAHQTLDAAHQSADTAIADARAVYDAALSTANARRAVAVSSFDAIAEELARKQMAKEDAPLPSDEKPPE